MPISDIILITMTLLSIAIVAAGLFRQVSIPYTVLLVVIGIALSELARVWAPLQELHEFTLTPELVFFVFLPALIFESGLSLDARQLIKDLAPVLTLAVPALLISTLLVGIGVWVLIGIDFTLALLFGALISATDPVAVIALFKELGAPPRLNLLVEGESLFNDATAIVVFGILLTMIMQDSSTDLLGVGWAVFEFLRVFIGGTLTGILFGLLVSEILYRLQSSDSAILTMSMVTAYASFILAEHSLHVSGVMATVSAAVTLSIYGLTRIPGDLKPRLTETWEFVGLVANSLLFLLVGLSINSAQLVSHIGLILVTVIIVQLARATSVYTLVPATLRLFNLPSISMAERHIMWWGGLKGGLAIAIVLSIPESLPGRDLLINLTLGVVLFTLMVNAWSIRPLMHRLKLDRLSDDEQSELEQGLSRASRSSAKLLNKYVSLGILSNELEQHLKQKLTAAFSRERGASSSTKARRKVYLAALRIESDALGEIYHAGLISQYSLLDMRNRLEMDRDHYSREDVAKQPSRNGEQNIFHRSEMRILKALREKNWAAGLLSRYQQQRLSQFIQRDIAAIIMSTAVIDQLATRDDLDKVAIREVTNTYQHRLHKRRQQLDEMRAEFQPGYDLIEKAMFTRVSLIAVHNCADHEFQHGEIGVKAYNRISQKLRRLIRHASDNNSLKQDNITSAISTVPLFSGLSDSALQLLSRHAHCVTFLQQDIIIGEHEKGDALYIILHGHAEASRKSENGESEKLGDLKDGDFFGEMALLGDHVRTATVTAKTAVTLLRLTRGDVIKVADQHEEVEQRLIQAMNERT